MSAEPVTEMVQVPPVFEIWGDDLKSRNVVLDRAVCVVGRQAGSNLLLESAKVSKVHALFVRQKGNVYVRDLASTNGVMCNGSPVQEAELSNGDVVTVGSHSLRCQSGFNPDDEADDAPIASAGPAELRLGETSIPFMPGRRTALIGRRDECEVRLEDPSVAPAHAIVLEIDGQRYIQHLGGPTRTSLNGKPIHREVLKPGDEIKVGATTLRYEQTSAPSAVESDDGIVEVAEAEEVEVEDVELAPLEPLEPMQDGAAQADDEPVAVEVEDEAPAESGAMDIVDDVEEEDVDVNLDDGPIELADESAVAEAEDASDVALEPLEAFVEARSPEPIPVEGENEVEVGEVAEEEPEAAVSEVDVVEPIAPGPELAPLEVAEDDEDDEIEDLVAPAREPAPEPDLDPLPTPVAKQVPPPAPLELSDELDDDAFPSIDLTIPEKDLPPTITLPQAASEIITDEIDWNVEVPPADIGVVPLAPLEDLPPLKYDAADAPAPAAKADVASEPAKENKPGKSKKPRSGKKKRGG